MNPFASVIVVTRNRADSLARALAAIQKLEYDRYEIVVVDNDSTDLTKKVVEDSSAKYIFSPSNCGIGASRQKGVESASGEIIAFCDDDCVPSPQWLSHLVRRLSQESDLGLVGGHVINVGFPGDSKQYKGRSKLGRNGKLVFVESIQDAEFYGNMNLAFRKEVIKAVGGYDPFFNVFEEIDLAIRIRKRGYRTDFEPAAVLEHHYTGVSFKRRHFFYGPELVRLYFCMKHQRPSSVSEWLVFLSYEIRLTIQGVFRACRKFLSALLKRKSDLLYSAMVDAFNILSARAAMPWLLWRVNASNATHRSTESL